MTHDIPAERLPWYAPHREWWAHGGTHQERRRWPNRGRRADLTGQCWREVDLTYALLKCAILVDVDLSGADLSYADLDNADLTGAILRDARMYGANIEGARGIASAGPVGASGVILHAVDHRDRVMIHAGEAWGPVDEIRAAVQRDYAHDTRRHAYLAAIDLVEAIVIAGRTA